MFVCIAGKNDIAVAALDYLIKLNGDYELGIVCNKTETGINGFQRSLRLFAEQNNIKEYQLEAIYEIEDLVFFLWNMIVLYVQIYLEAIDYLIYIFRNFLNIRECIHQQFLS